MALRVPSVSKLKAALIAGTLSLQVFAQEQVPPLKEDTGAQTRSQQIPREHLSQANDSFLEGYLQALLDMHYYEFQLYVKIHDKKATLYNVPDNNLIHDSIIHFVEDFPDVTLETIYNEKQIAMAKEAAQKTVEEQPTSVTSQASDQKQESVMAMTQVIEDPDIVKSIWFPQSTILFPYPAADPRRVAYSLSFRRENQGSFDGASTALASFGEVFPIKRWLNVGPFYGDLQLSIDGAAWGYFELNSEQELVNTDYYVGIPVAYAFDNWSFRLRYYHMSSHLGDEYMVSHPDATRLNPSMEATDLLASYYFLSSWRVYGGLGYVVRSDSSFKLDPWYFEGGLECRPESVQKNMDHIHFQPYWAVHVRVAEDDAWNPDYTANIGYEISKLQNIGRKVRLFLEFHDGRSYQGQFSKEKEQYVSLNLSYGF